jgi:CheY-like chemotaxis protein
VKRLVVLHGGTVEARSAGPDQGSVFVFRMPTSKHAPKSTHIDPNVPPVPRKIVVVDDNADAADTLAVLLRSNGHVVQTANSGREALEIAESTRPDIMFLDIGMPGMNGYEVCREIRGSEWGRDLPIVALTGWDQDRTRIRGIEAGFAAHLVKPVHFDKINQTLRDMLDGRAER